MPCLHHPPSQTTCLTVLSLSSKNTFLARQGVRGAGWGDYRDIVQGWVLVLLHSLIIFTKKLDICARLAEYNWSHYYMTYHICIDSDNDNITGAANEGGELNNCQGLDLGKLGRRGGGGGESIWPLPRFCRSQFSIFIKYEDVWEPNKSKRKA